MKTNLTQSEQFFYDHAGYSYNPKTQTAEQGRIECAKHLAKVEALAKQLGVKYEWGYCDTTSKEFSDEKPFYNLYSCVAYLNGEVVGSLGGIDFGRGNSYRGQPYKRVVEAEIACDLYMEHELAFGAACSDIETIA